MRYQIRVSDIDKSGLTRLSTAEARFVDALSHPRSIALAGIVGLTALAWLALGLMAAEPTAPLWQAICRPAPADGWTAALLAAPMWAAMAPAMMLPTAGPMILTYAEIADTAARKGERVVSPLVLIAGYIVVWLGFACVAATLQGLLARGGLFDGGYTARLLAGALAVGAGLYQFSALKQACLTKCQRPFPFFFANWTTEASGVLRLGLRQGVTCLGCCWAMMTLMLAVGAMNVVWMAALGVVMTIEKMTSTATFSKALGVVFLAAGGGLLVLSVQ
jgi:predicted metal-binding membrane protein